MKYFLINIAVIVTFSIIFNGFTLSIERKKKNKRKSFEKGDLTQRLSIVVYILLVLIAIYEMKMNLIYISKISIFMFAVLLFLLTFRLKRNNE